MTFNYLTHAEAAKAKAEGKDVQAMFGYHDVPIPFEWDHLNNPNLKFRLAPPAPRVAQEFWLIGSTDEPIKVWAHEPAYPQVNEAWRKRVREVLPGEPTVREAVREALELAHGRLHAMNLLQAAGVVFDLKYELCGDVE